MNRSPLRPLLTIAVVLCLGIALGRPADAVTFTFTQEGGFNSGSGQPFDSLEFFSGATLADTFRVVGWGNNAPRSTDPAINPFVNPDRSALALQTNSPLPNPPVIEPFATAGAMPTTIQDDGNFVELSRLFHQNNVISGPSLTQITIETLLTIRAPDNSIVYVDPAPHPIAIEFVETPNDGSCAAGLNPLGSDCDDRFLFNVADLFPVSFTFDPGDGLHVYDVFFGLFIPGNTLPCSESSGQHACVEFDPQTGVGTTFTREGSLNQLDVVFAIVQRPDAVPQPAVALLIGVGLLAMAAHRRGRPR